VWDNIAVLAYLLEEVAAGAGQGRLENIAAEVQHYNTLQYAVAHDPR